jgi:DNA-binding NarL/FixJ family response regulator
VVITSSKAMAAQQGECASRVLMLSCGRRTMPADRYKMRRADMTQILIAEDNKRFRTFLRTLLKQRHDDWAVCGEAKNGAEAVQKAIKLKPEVILLDIEMPKLDGLSACRLIREKVPTSEILILTVYQSLELARIAADSGAWGYVSKTLISRDLIPAIEAMMSPRR